MMQGFPRRVGLKTILLAGMALAACVTVGHTQTPAPSQANLDAGKLAYRQYCAQCHGFNLSDGEMGPAIEGPAFRARWGDRAALLTYIQDRMPPGGGRTLSPQVYDDITSYVLVENQPGPPGGAVSPAVAAARKAKLDTLRQVTDDMLANPAEGDWLIWRGNVQQTGFSKLRQVDKSNVAGLQQAWQWNMPESQNGVTPIIHDGVMFISGGHQVAALDAVTGDLLWQYDRPLAPRFESGRNMRGPRAYGIYGDKIFLGTADRHVIALNFRTGALVWDVPVGEQYPDMRVGGAPLVVKGKVILGTSGATFVKGGNYILGLDAETGREAWRFHTVARPGDVGGDTWNGAPADARFGGGVWTGASYDPKTNLIFIGASPTYTTGTLLQRPAKGKSSDEGLFTDSTIALNPETGKLVWHFQHQNRDVWDTDWAFERTVATINYQGRPRDVVMTAGKPALFDVLDAATGKYLFSKDMGLQTMISGVDPKTGRKIVAPNATPEYGKTKLACGFIRNWPTTAFNPNSRILYVPLGEGGCSNYSWQARTPEAVARGGFDVLYEPAARPGGTGGYVSRIQAVNMDTGEMLWTRRQRAGTASSLLATAGGLVFGGTGDRYFRAHDETNGEVLWETRLNAAPRSNPVTYAVGGEQYVAVVSGPGGGNPSAPANLTVSVFKLPKGRGAN